MFEHHHDRTYNVFVRKCVGYFSIGCVDDVGDFEFAQNITVGGGCHVGNEEAVFNHRVDTSPVNTVQVIVCFAVDIYKYMHPVTAVRCFTSLTQRASPDVWCFPSMP